MRVSSRRRAEGKRAELVEAVRQEAGLGKCLELCDADYMERVCDLVPEAFAASRHDSRSELPAALRNILIAALKQYRSSLTSMPRTVRMEDQPTIDFIDAAEAVAKQIEVGPWSEADTSKAKHLLRYAWCTWITYVASYWMWSEVPKLLASKQLSRVNGKKSTGRAKTLNHDAIVATYWRLSESKDKRNIASLVAREHSCSDTSVRNVMKAHEKEKKAKQPMG